MRLFLSSRLVKAGDVADPPSPGGSTPKGYDPSNVDYVSKKDSPQRPQSAVGETQASWVVPKGSSSPATPTSTTSEDSEKLKAEKQELSKDPLKPGAEPKPSADLAGAKKIQEAQTGTGDQDFLSPWDEEGDPKAEGNMQAMEHYHAANLADKLGDQKEALKHRDLAKEKTADHDGPMHQDMAEKLRAAGYHDDAEHHSNARKEWVTSQAGGHIDEIRAKREAAGQGPLDMDVESGDAPVPKEQQDTHQSDFQRMQARKERMRADRDKTEHKERTDRTLAQQKEHPVRNTGTGTVEAVPEGESKEDWNARMKRKQGERADKDERDAETQRRSRKESREDVRDRQKARKEANDKYQAEEQARAQQEPGAQEQAPPGAQEQAPPGAQEPGAQEQAPPGAQEPGAQEPGAQEEPDLKARQQEAQKKATEDFKAKAAEHEQAKKDAEEEQKNYDSALKDHEDAMKDHEVQMNRLKDQMQSIREKKPVKNSTETDKIKQQLSETRREQQKHRLDKPSTRKLRDHEKKIKEQKKTASEKVKQKVSSLKETHRSDLDKLANKKPIRTEKDDDKSFEAKVRAHQNKTEKLKSAHAEKISGIQQKHQEHLNALDSQHELLTKQHQDAVDAHDRKAEELARKKLKLETSHEKAKKTADAQHKKDVAAHEKKLKSKKEQMGKHKDAKKDLPPKPAPPKTKEPKQTHKKPETAAEQAAHKQYTEHHAQRAANIESHLKDNQDLTPEQRKEMEDLHAEHSYHASVEHSPTKEDKAASREISNRSKNLGADKHHDEVKATKQAQAEKEQKEFDKKRAQAEKRDQTEQSNTPRPPTSPVEEAQVQDHSRKAKDAADNIRSHLEGNEDLSDEERSTLEEMASKLDEHAGSKTVPTKDQQAELKEALKHTKKHSGKKFEDAEGAASSGQTKDTSSADKKRSTTGSIRRLYSAGGAAGARAGSAAANPYGGAGDLAATALNTPGRGVASAGHYLFERKRPAKQSEQSENPETKEASISRLYVRIK